MAVEPRRRILDVAMTRFLADGIRAPSVDAVVEEAGVSKATVYRHFATKELLVEAVVRARDELWRERFGRLVGGRTGVAGIRAIFASLEPWFAADDYRGCSLLNSAVEGTELSPGARRIVVANRGWMQDLLARLAAEAGCADPTEVGAQLLVVLDGAIIRALVEDSPAPARRAAAIAEVLLAAG